MDTADVLTDAFERIRGLVDEAVDGLDEERLAYRVDRDANSIAWLIWHSSRVQDHHIAGLSGRDQAWIAEGWADRFGMDPDPENTGYGHTSDEVAGIRPPGPDVLKEYHRAVHERTQEYLSTVDADELERLVDWRWDPPVSAGVRLVSIIGDCYQHVGQALYVRGILERAGEG